LYMAQDVAFRAGTSTVRDSAQIESVAAPEVALAYAPALYSGAVKLTRISREPWT